MNTRFQEEEEGRKKGGAALKGGLGVHSWP